MRKENDPANVCPLRLREHRSATRLPREHQSATRLPREHRVPLIIYVIHCPNMSIGTRQYELCATPSYIGAALDHVLWILD